MTTIANTIRAALAEGKSNDEVLEAVKAAHPGANTTRACVSFYRSKMRKEGKQPMTLDRFTTIVKESAKRQAANEEVVRKAASAVYSVKNVKTFVGMEGQGYNATLYRDGVAVATVIDDATGGPIMIQWKDLSVAKDEDALLERTAKAMPPMVCSFNEPGTDQPATLEMTGDLLVEELVNDFILLRDMRRLTKAKVALVDGGKLYTVKMAPSPASIKMVQNQHPKASILNGLDDAELLRVAKTLQQ